MSLNTLYAELLLNVRQVTVSATLQSEQNKETAIKLSPDRKSLSLIQDRETVTLELPSNVIDEIGIPILVPGTKQLSFRLQIPNNHQHANHIEPNAENIVPWPARLLTADTELACRSCKNLVTKGQIEEWRDLPSENWAEMMEFWHCHKPGLGTDQDEKALSTGYTASNRLSTRRGLGLVDVCHVVVSQEDCFGLKDQYENSSSLHCSCCNSVVGLKDNTLSGTRLYKWSMSMRRNSGTAWEEVPVQKFMCAQLLDSIENCASRRFLAYSGNLKDAKEALLLWVFTPDMWYSASTIAKGPRRAAKILYQVVRNPSEILAKQNTSMEELQVPEPMLLEIGKDLEASSLILPVFARTMQEWNVGLLDRLDTTSSL